MAITWQTPGTADSGTTSSAPSYPANSASTDLLIYSVALKPYNTTAEPPATPWNGYQASATDGTTASGNGTGSNRCLSFAFVAAQSYSGTFTVTHSAGNVHVGQAHRFSKGATEDWSQHWSFGADKDPSGLTVSAVAEPAITERLSHNSTITGQVTVPTDGTVIWQSFTTPTTAFHLTRFDINIQVTGTLDGNVSVGIYNAATGGTTIVSETVAASTLSTGTASFFVNATHGDVLGDSTYYFRMSRSGGSTGTLDINYNSSNPYASGRLSPNTAWDAAQFAAYGVPQPREIYSAGDYLYIAVALCDDALTHSGQSVTLAGATLGSVTWHRSTTTSGNDESIYIGACSINSVTTVTGYPTYAATAGASGKSHTSINVGRLRAAESSTPKTGTETVTIGVSDSASVTVTGLNKDVTDSVGVSVGDIAAIVTTEGKDVTDTLTVAVGDVLTARTTDTVDTVGVSVGDTQVLDGFSSHTDTFTIGVADTSAAVVNLTVTDTLTVAVADAQVSQSTLGVSDSATVAVADVQASALSSALAETLTIAVGDVGVAQEQTTTVEKTASDTITIDVATGGGTDVQDKTTIGGGHQSWTPPAGTTSIVIEGWGEKFGADNGGYARGTLAYSGQSLWWALDTDDGEVGGAASFFVTTHTGPDYKLAAFGGGLGASGTGTVLSPLTDPTTTTGGSTGAQHIKMTSTVSGGVGLDATSTVTETITITAGDVITDRAITVSDSVTVAVGDVASKQDMGGEYFLSDPITISVTDTAQITARGFEVSDSVTVSVTPVQTSALSSDTTDTATIAVADVQASASTLTAADSATITVGEAASYLGTGTYDVTDTVGITLADSGSLGGSTSPSASDSVSIAVGDVATLLKQISVTDTATISVTESVDLQKPITATDTVGISVTQAATLFKDITVSDTATLAVTMAASTGGSETKDVVDTVTVSVTQTMTPPMAITVVATDTLTISVDPVASFLKQISVSNTVTIGVSMASSGGAPPGYPLTVRVYNGYGWVTAQNFFVRIIGDTWMTPTFIGKHNGNTWVG